MANRITIIMAKDRESFLAYVKHEKGILATGETYSDTIENLQDVIDSFCHAFPDEKPKFKNNVGELYKFNVVTVSDLRAYDDLAKIIKDLKSFKDEKSSASLGRIIKDLKTFQKGFEGPL